MRKSKKHTKEVIFEEAIELFSVKGYSGTSMRDLARNVGVKESSLYNHYKGKEAILQAILDYYMENFNESLKSLDELKNSGIEFENAIDFWMAGVQEYLKNQKKFTDKITRILINEMYLNEQCRDFVLTSMFSAQKELTKTIFYAMFKQGLIKESNVEMAASQYVYMIQGLGIENNLLLLNGEKQELLFSKMFDHMKYFIEKL